MRMKIDRLLSITTILLNRGTVTARELAERFGVSLRTIYRDIDALSEAGIPVYTSQGVSGGISILEDYTLGRLPVSDQEKDGILLALQALTATRFPEADRALEKLSALFRNAHTDWVSVNFSAYGISAKEREKFETIRKCILEARLLSFDYTSGKGEVSQRTVEPVKLWFWGEAWYVWAFCRTKDAYRTFKVSRMKNPKTGQEQFLPRRDVSFEEYVATLSDTRPQVWLKMKIFPRARYRCYDLFDFGQIKPNEDGTLQVEACLPESEWLYGMLLSFGCDLEVLEPRHIREILAERMREALQFYEI